MAVKHRQQDTTIRLRFWVNKTPLFCQQQAVADNDEM
jgi:hypothetical protein